MQKGLVLGMPALIECPDIRDAVRICKDLSLEKSVEYLRKKSIVSRS